MKPRVNWWLMGLVGMAVVVMVLLVFHLGPTLGVFEGGPRVMGHLALRDGSSLFLVQTRNDDPVEAYTVELYRIYRSGAAEVCMVGYEESYWWLPSLRVGTNETEAVLRADGESMCLYDSTVRQVSWLDGSYPPQPAREAAGKALTKVRQMYFDGAH